MFARGLYLLLVLGAPLAAMAQDKMPTLAQDKAAQDKLPAPRPPPTAPQVRSVVLAYQQLGLSLESLTTYYEARIEELKRICGDPCKDK